MPMDSGYNVFKEIDKKVKNPDHKSDAQLLQEDHARQAGIINAQQIIIVALALVALCAIGVAWWACG